MSASGLAAHLSPAELGQRYRAARPPVERSHLQIVWLLSRGRSEREVAQVTGYGRRWVSEVARRYDEGGPDGLGDRRRGNAGARPLLGAEGEAALRAALAEPPADGGLWTGPKVATWMAARLGREVRPQRGWDYLRKLGHSAQVPRPLEAGAHLAPARPIGAGQIAGVPAAQPGGQTGEQPHRAAQHRRRAVGLAAGRPPLVAAVRAEQLLEPVVGARQVGDGVAVEQAGPVAAGHLQEVVDGAGERAGLGAVAADGGDEPGEAAGDRGRVEARRVVQDPGRAVHPAVGAADVRPEVAGAVQGVREQPAQAPQEPRHPPFSATRSRLATTASSRSASSRPEAAKGGRPSSVIALRTAAQ